MRFRAHVRNPKLFAQFCNVVGRVSKSCTIVLHKTRIRFICQTDLQDGTQVWVGVNTDVLFSDFRLESSLEDQSIWTLVDLENLQRALKSGELAREMLVKLAKHGNCPVLVFSMAVEGLGDRPRHDLITQEVPVRVLPKEKIDTLKPPQLPDTGVRLFLPAALKDIKSIVDRVKTLSPAVTLSADTSGTMRLKVETQQLSTVTRWTNLMRPMDDVVRAAQQSALPTPQTVATVVDCRMDTKKLLAFLACHQLAPKSVLCHFIHRTALCIKVETHDAAMVYYIPCMRQS